MEGNTTKVHMGQNVKFFRTAKGIKQSSLADMMGVSQQAISILETREVLDKEVLTKIANLIDVNVETLETFPTGQGVNIIAETFNNTNNEGSAFYQHQPTIHPVDKVSELYERMLREKDIEIVNLKAELERLQKGK